VSGLCALALEVMWTRALSIAVGTTTYSFTVMLASFLIGIWLGSWLHSAIRLRSVPVHVQLGAVLVVIGVASIGTSLLIPRLPDLVVKLNVWLYGVAPRIGLGTILLGGFGVMLVPCVFMGVAFPLSAQARAQLGRGFGRSAGDTLGWNTLGSVAGSLLTGFVLIPTLGLQRGMLLAASVYVAYGGLVLAAPLVVGARGAQWRRALPASVGAAVVAGAALWLPSRMSTWDVRSLGGFQNNKLDDYVSGEGEVSVRERLDEVVVLHYLEGRASTVSVVDVEGDLALLVNGKAVASDNAVDIHHLLMLGHMPVLIHPAPKQALVIGMGAGFTLGSVTAHPDLDAVKLVEIEPAVLAAQPFYAGVDGDPLSDPRLTVEFQDARNYLKTTNERFDVITSDPIHPWNANSGYLFTLEFYSMARQALNPGGIMCQWLPIYGLSIENFRSIVATFDAAFEHTMIWQMGYDAALVGSAQPFKIDFEDLERRLRQPSVRNQLEEIGLADPHSFLAELALDPGASSDYARGGIVNTDDNLYVEFASPASHGTPEISQNADRINEYRREPYLDASFLAISETERRTLDLHRKARFATLEIYFDGQNPAERAKKVQQVLETTPGYRPAEIMLAKIRNNMALTLLNAGLGQAAVHAAEEAVALDPRNAAAHRTLGTALLIVGRHADAVAELERSLALRPGRWRVLVLLSVALEGEGRDSEAAQALRAAIAINPHNPDLAERLESLDAPG
jgi:spermidine synthase